MSAGVWIAAATSVYLLLGVIALARRKPGYSHLVHTISELGETGSRDQRLVAWGLFFPVAAALAGLAFLSWPLAEELAWLAGCVAVGYGVAVVFPCDQGSPVTGSWRQGLHNLGGAVQYIGGGLALVNAAGRWGGAAEAAGYLVLATAAALTFLPARSWRGLAQRIGEFVLFGALVVLTLAPWRAS